MGSSTKLAHRIMPPIESGTGARARAEHIAWTVTGLVVGLPPDPELNSLTDRAAMGLPEHYAGPDGAGVSREIERLLKPSPAALAERVEEVGASFEQRYAAGLLLGMGTDPRIEALDPKMVDVPGGEYLVGLPPDRMEGVVAEFAEYGVRREWIEKETPQHARTLAPFRIARYPLTNGEYRRFLLETGHPRLPSSWMTGSLRPGADNQPVFGILPEDADSYAAWLSRVTGRKFRLPGEAEWEVAASGGDGRTYPWGNEFEKGKANTLEAGVLTSTPVGLFPEGQSPFGCLDMAGNVEEYVSECYTPYPGARFVADDLLLNGTGYRIARGGSFTRYRDLARCQRRHGFYPKSIYAMGFRLAEDAQ